MKLPTNYFLAGLILAFASAPLFAQQADTGTDALYRPQLHFSPSSQWVNDPNGMVFWKGTYHLFYQHNPLAAVWGPMHWGHATSKDLVHWQQQPIALYPDSLGTIFSGSAVVDTANTSGFGKKGQIPLVAIFTHHNEQRERAGQNNFQYQSLAYSLDDGNTWTKYSGNPVLKNPGIRDFRDPKVFWHLATQRWIMALAVYDRIHFYSSPDLKQWTKESEFGAAVGFHGGVWECPDLFPLPFEGKTYWILIVNIGSGGPNKGSATQYFLGDFDGRHFTALTNEAYWLDYGPDEYAGVTWSNAGDRRLFMGWMSNWRYANQVPTKGWRNAMTLARQLKLVNTPAGLRVAALPVREVTSLFEPALVSNNFILAKPIPVGDAQGNFRIPFQLRLDTDTLNNFQLAITNRAGDSILAGYDPIAREFYIDRTHSGNTAFHPEFAARITAPRMTLHPWCRISLVVDQSSIELFADDGLTVMTTLFFPRQVMEECRLTASGSMVFRQLSYQSASRIR